MFTRTSHPMHGDGADASSALDVLLVAESEAQHALQEADARASRILDEARTRVSELELAAATALREALDHAEAVHQLALAEALKGCTEDAEHRVARYRALTEDDRQGLARAVVERLAGSAL